MDSINLSQCISSKPITHLPVLNEILSCMLIINSVVAKEIVGIFVGPFKYFFFLSLNVGPIHTRCKGTS